jgi:uncharacterized protein (TIGR02246 family)
MRRLILLIPVLVCTGAIAAAQSPAGSSVEAGDESAIRAVIAAQAAAWNRADIPAFMQAYEDSPDTTFIGSAVRKGYQPILERYRAGYANAAQMGTLTFSNLEIRLLPSPCGPVEYALVTGNFHLERTEKGAATKDDGIFSLAWRKTPQGWKIILDHSS